ncbi:MAG TPA: phosphatidylglycerophosphatase A, partial [Bryobacteraceae bacterium]|nr:phosphatidylglycerophosphatase A [Bryobacteraceae bacterium]
MAAERTRSAWLFGTFFGAGYFPKGPGTAGSLAAILIAIPLVQFGIHAWGFAALSLAFLYPGIWAAGRVAIESGRKDPQIVVVDEVLGQWLTLAGAARLNWKALAIGFVLFRLFDILKPPPVRQIERVPGGAGIVLDDMMAGVYGALVLCAAG